MKRLLLSFCFLWAAPSLAYNTTYTTETQPSNFMWLSEYLTANTQYTIDTRNLSAGDTVLHVLQCVTYPCTQVAANDDAVGLASRVTFTASATGYYRVLVRGYSSFSGGRADVYVNNTLVMYQGVFGGQVTSTFFDTSDEVRVVGTRRAYTNDLMVFLLRDNTNVVGFDDDSGPNFLPYIRPTTNESTYSARIAWGFYPGANPGYARLIQQCRTAICTNGDPDGDGLHSALESKITSNPNVYDTDNDTIPDWMEVLGNDGYSFAEDASPVRRNLYVEIDFMVNPNNDTLSRRPNPFLASDLAYTFLTDAQVDATILVANAIPWTEFIDFVDCRGTSVPNCVNFYDLKQANFSTQNPERRPYFHYVVWANKRLGTASLGQGEILGNDSIIAMGSAKTFDINNQPVVPLQKSAFMHELGHNINLDHNGNGNLNLGDGGANSVVHRSVMNYRFSSTGADGNYGYSNGVNGCTSCYSSVKSSCVQIRTAGACNLVPNCDCDINEWGALNFDFYEGASKDYGDGPGTDYDNAPVIGGTPPLKSNELKRPISEREARVKHEPSSSKRARVAQRVAGLEKDGKVRGRDFILNSDGTAILSVD
jgi:hypothetical protein